MCLFAHQSRAENLSSCVLCVRSCVQSHLGGRWPELAAVHFGKPARWLAAWASLCPSGPFDLPRSARALRPFSAALGRPNGRQSGRLIYNR